MNRLLSNMLFVPASDQRKLDKIAGLHAAAYILDLEDAVAVSAKAEARARAAACVGQLGATKDLYVRINAMETSYWEEDLRAMALPGLIGINLPKVSAAGQVEEIHARLLALERDRDLPQGGIELMTTMETVAGIRNLDAIAAAPRVRCLCFGAGDFSLDIGLDWPPPSGRLAATVVAAKVALVMASRAHGLPPPHDGVFPNFRDSEGLRVEAEEARALGFFGKHAIHPDQLPIIDAVFRPSPARISQARAIVDAFEQSEAAGRANIHIEGQFIDYPVVARARQVLALADEQAE